MYFRRPDWEKSILSEYDLFRSSMDALRDGYRETLTKNYPAINLWTNKDKIMLTAELPGLKAEELEVSVRGDSVILEGKPAKEQENRNYHRRERSQCEWQRSIKLPCAVDAAKVEARLEKGILAVVMPRSEADKPKSITVQSA